MVCAVPAIHAAGSQAIAVSPDCTHGSGAVRQAASPTIVAIGAAGAASRFAMTPYSGTVGVMSTRSGPHASCAASGTDRARASARGMRRASPVGERPGEQQQRAGRDGGEREAERARRARGRPPAARVTARQSTAMPAPGAAEQHAQHRDERHRRRAHDARLGCHEQHEADQRDDTAGHPRPPRAADRGHRPEGEARPRSRSSLPTPR